MAVLDTWLVIHLDGKVWAWNLGDCDEQVRADSADAARALVGFPADDNWLLQPGRSVDITFGEPHETLLARAEVGTLADLRKVKKNAVAAYRKAYADVQRATAIESARRILSGLDGATVAEILGLPPTT